MGGRAPAAGFQFQDRAFAYVAVHALLQRPLGWHVAFDSAPFAIAGETGTGGDDLRVELDSGQLIEVQAKRNIGRSNALAELVRLAQYVAGRRDLLGVLVVGVRASQPIRLELKDTLRRLADGRQDGLPTIGREFAEQLAETGLDGLTACKRLVVYPCDLEDLGADHQRSIDLLHLIVADPNDAATAWTLLCEEGRRVSAQGGRSDRSRLLQLLQRHIRLSPDVHQNQAPWSSSTVGGTVVRQGPVLELPADSQVPNLGQTPQVVQIVHHHHYAAAGSGDEASAGMVKVRIDLALQSLDELRPQACLRQLDALETDLGPVLTPRNRFVILANRARAHLLMDNSEEAARLFVEATRIADPDEKRVDLVRAMACSLQGDRSEAHRLAGQCLGLLGVEDAASAAVTWLSTAPDTEPVAALIDQLSAADMLHPRVAWAVALRAQAEGDLDTAEEFARQAVDARPGDAEACTLLAGILIRRQFGPEIQAGFSAPPVAQWDGYEEVHQLLTKALEVAGAVAEPSQLVQYRRNLALLYRITGDNTRAEEELLQALPAKPGNVDTLLALVDVLEVTGQRDRAILRCRECLAEHESKRVELRLVELLLARDATDDVSAATELLTQGWAGLGGENRDLRQAWGVLFVQVHCAVGQVEAARKALTELSPILHSEAMRLVLESKVETTAGQLDAARRKVKEAAAALGAGDGQDVRAPVATLHERLDLHREAAELWLALAGEPPAAGAAARHYVSCAWRLSQFGAVAAFCADLRQSQACEQWYIEAELAALERLSQRRKLDALQEMLAGPLDGPFRKFLQADLSYTAILLCRRDLVDADPVHLPAVADVTAVDRGRVVVNVLRHSEDPWHAVRYGYELFRRFPDHFEAHMAVLESTGFPYSDLEWPAASVAGPGTAVQYREESADTENWFILEDLPEPSLRLRERAPADPLCQAFLGQKLGDTVELPGDLHPRATAVIVQIVSKYLYRWQNCFLHLEDFPDRSPLRRLRVTEDEDGTPDIEFILDRLRQTEAHREHAHAVYRRGPLPLHTLGEWQGRTVFETVQRVAWDDRTPLRCCRGDADEVAQAFRNLRSAKALVLDESALGTLYWLDTASAVDAQRLLDTISFDLLVPERVVDNVRSVPAAIPSRGHMFLGMRDGQAYRELLSDEQVAELREAFTMFVDRVEDACQVVPGFLAADAMEPVQREWAEMFGLGNVEAASLAATPDRVLWTDDLALATIAQSEMAVQRVWTQGLCRWLRDERRLESVEYAQISVRLFQAGFGFTSIDSSVVLEAGRLSAWNVEEEPLRGVLNHFANRRVSHESIVGLSAGLFRELWTGTTHLGHDWPVTWRVLERLSQRPGFAGLVAVLHLHAERIFGGDRLAAYRARRLFRRWLRIMT